jgi:hypothetical protein
LWNKGSLRYNENVQLKLTKGCNMFTAIPFIRTKKDAIQLLGEASKEIGKICHFGTYRWILAVQGAIQNNDKLNAQVYLRFALKNTDNPKVMEVNNWVLGTGRYLRL